MHLARTELASRQSLSLGMVVDLMWDVRKDVEVFVVIIGIEFIRIRLGDIMVRLSYYFWDEKDGDQSPGYIDGS